MRRKIQQLCLSSLTEHFHAECGIIEKLLYREEFENIIGVDEAGRGSLAGPVVAAALSLPKNHGISGIYDSKKLSSSKRLQIYEEITQSGHLFGIASVAHEEIDRINILQASKLAMRKALVRLLEKVQPHVVKGALPLLDRCIIVVDGNQMLDINFAMPQRCFVKGDSLSENIAAASILAKVERDRIMERIHAEFPQYGFDKNRGYPTKEHLEALAAHGATPYHRRSFKPVRVLTP